MPENAILLRITESEFAAGEIGDFLLLFQRNYTASLRAFESFSRDDIENSSSDEILQAISDHVRKLTIEELNSLFTEDLGDRRLNPIQISKSSPLELCLTGVLVAIAAAVVLAGGKIKIWGVEAEIDISLGDAIGRLR